MSDIGLYIALLSCHKNYIGRLLCWFGFEWFSPLKTLLNRVKSYPKTAAAAHNTTTRWKGRTGAETQREKGTLWWYHFQVSKLCWMLLSSRDNFSSYIINIKNNSIMKPKVTSTRAKLLLSSQTIRKHVKAAFERHNPSSPLRKLWEEGTNSPQFKNYLSLGSDTNCIE